MTTTTARRIDVSGVYCHVERCFAVMPMAVHESMFAQEFSFPWCSSFLILATGHAISSPTRITRICINNYVIKSEQLNKENLYECVRMYLKKNRVTVSVVIFPAECKGGSLILGSKTQLYSSSKKSAIHNRPKSPILPSGRSQTKFSFWTEFRLSKINTDDWSEIRINH